MNPLEDFFEDEDLLFINFDSFFLNLLTSFSIESSCEPFPAEDSGKFSFESLEEESSSRFL